MAIYNQVEKILTTGREAKLITVIGGDQDRTVVGRKIIMAGKEIIYSGLDEMTTAHIENEAESLSAAGQSTVGKIGYDEGERLELFFHAYAPPPRLIIMGGGHVGAAVCRLAAQLDYETVLIDDRPAFVSPQMHPHANRLICEPFEKALDQLDPSPTDYLVIVTRGHRYDRLCLEKSLDREAAYIGMIGSRRRVKAQLEDLAGQGYPRELLERVYSPIGLPIGAVTEAEIAISILAEITKVRRSKSSEEAVEKSILQELCRLENQSTRAALATVVRTQGSTPRKTGSQMIIFPDGSLKGTIGGGCAESEVRREALNCLEEGRAVLFKLEMTAEAAAEEGMACGGIMDVFLEPLPPFCPEKFS